MNDDQIRDALDRRSRSAQFRADELLPGVRRGLGVSPRPARVARWASLAGLAAAAVIVIALIIAFPGGRGIGGASPSPSSSLDVMTTQEFASAYAAGSLDGETVLVDGEIVAYDGPPIEPPCGGELSVCVIGQLDAISPLVIVNANDIAVPSGTLGAGTVQHGTDWATWMRLQAPIHGTLVLTVEGDSVTYLGRVVPNGDQLTWSPGEAQRELDVASRQLDDVVLVNGWLTGVDIPAPCAPLPTTFSGLPERHACGQDSWIADQADVLTSQAAPQAAIEVQPDAFASYAPDPTATIDDGSLRPQRSLYAVSKRLYGQFCTDSSQPCWGWSIVGRLTQPAPDTEPPSLAPAMTPELASTPPTTVSPVQSGPQIDCGNDMSLLDSTGQVATCTSVSGFGPALGLTASPTRVTVQWQGAMCTPIVTASFESSSRGYVLSITEASRPYTPGTPSCAGGVATRTLALTVFSPLVGPVNATVDGQDLSLASPSPTVSSTFPQTTPTATGPVSDATSSGDFALTITAPKSVYTPDEAIDIQADLAYTGNDSSAVLSGSGSGLVVFGVKQVDGNLAVDGVWTADCKLGGYSLTPGNPMNIPFAKSGGFDASGPGANFDKTYFADPLLHLTPGQWEIYAASDFYVGSTCDGDDVMMRATIDIDVVGN